MALKNGQPIGLGDALKQRAAWQGVLREPPRGMDAGPIWLVMDDERRLVMLDTEHAQTLDEEDAEMMSVREVIQSTVEDAVGDGPAIPEGNAPNTGVDLDTRPMPTGEIAGLGVTDTGDVDMPELPTPEPEGGKWGGGTTPHLPDEPTPIEDTPVGKPIALTEVLENQESWTALLEEPGRLVETGDSERRHEPGARWVVMNDERRLVVLDDEYEQAHERTDAARDIIDTELRTKTDLQSKDTVAVPSTGVDLDTSRLSREEIDALDVTKIEPSMAGVEIGEPIGLAEATRQRPQWQGVLHEANTGHVDIDGEQQSIETSSTWVVMDGKRRQVLLEEEHAQTLDTQTEGWNARDAIRTEIDKTSKKGAPVHEECVWQYEDRIEDDKPIPAQELSSHKSKSSKSLRELWAELDPSDIDRAALEQTNGKVDRCWLTSRWGERHAVDLRDGPGERLDSAAQWLQDELRLPAHRVEIATTGGEASRLGGSGEDNAMLGSVFALRTRTGARSERERIGREALDQVKLIEMDDPTKVMAVGAGGARIHPCPSDPEEAMQWLERLTNAQRKRDKDPVETTTDMQRWQREAGRWRRALETRMNDTRPRTLAIVQDGPDRWRLEGTTRDGETVDLLDGGRIGSYERARKIASAAAEPQRLEVATEAHTETRTDVFAARNAKGAELWKKLGWPNGTPPKTVSLAVRLGRDGEPKIAICAGTSDGKTHMLDSPKGLDPGRTALWLNQVQQAGGPKRVENRATPEQLEAAGSSTSAKARRETALRWPTTRMAAYDTKADAHGKRNVHPHAVWCRAGDSERAIPAHQVSDHKVVKKGNGYTVQALVPVQYDSKTVELKAVELVGAERSSKQAAQALCDTAQRNCALARRAHGRFNQDLTQVARRAHAKAHHEHNMHHSFVAVGKGLRRYALPLAGVTAAGLMLPIAAPVMTAALGTAGVLAGMRLAHDAVHMMRKRKKSAQATIRDERARILKDWREGETTAKVWTEERESGSHHVSDYTRAETHERTPEGRLIAGTRNRTDHTQNAPPPSRDTPRSKKRREGRER